jgi:hypothetical protein
MGNDRYAGMNNNPLSFTDPTGHSVVCGTDEEGCDYYSNEVDPEPPPIGLPDAPPDFNNPNAEGNPPPPHVDDLPDEEWEWDDNWLHLGKGYRNRKDPWGTVYRPDEGFYDPESPWGEQPHWNMRRPGQTGPGMDYPLDPKWGRPGQRPGPGVFIPEKGAYVIVLITAGTAVTFQIISSFGFGGGGGGGILFENMVR